MAAWCLNCGDRLFTAPAPYVPDCDRCRDTSPAVAQVEAPQQAHKAARTPGQPENTDRDPQQMDLF